MIAIDDLQTNPEGARPAVFLDRDGVLIANVFYEDSGLWEAPRTADRCVLYPWTSDALLLLQNAGYSLIVISNQPNAALGKSTTDELAEVHEGMEGALRKQGVVLTASYYCFHHPRARDPSLRSCDCRKPSPRMVFDAAAEHGIDLRRSWMIGDRDTDIECGKKAKVRTIKVAPDHPPSLKGEEYPPNVDARNLLEATRLILNPIG